MTINEIRIRALTLKSEDCPQWATPITEAEWRLGWVQVNSTRFLKPKKQSAPPHLSDVYLAYMQSNEWAAMRGSVLLLARFKCAKCGGAASDVHHKSYERFGNEELIDLEPICRKCHQAEHGGPLTPYIRAIFERPKRLRRSA